MLGSNELNEGNLQATYMLGNLPEHKRKGRALGKRNEKVEEVEENGRGGFGEIIFLHNLL
jgi:hypothetical protein